MSRELDSLGWRLRETRTARGLTQTELAKLSGVRQSNISKLERGDSVSTSGIARLARALEVDPLWLELGEGVPPQLPHDAKAMGHELSPAPVSMPPSLSWEKLTEMKKLPNKFVLTLRDASMHPKLTRGTQVVFHATEIAETGQVVLIRAAGGYHVRELRMQADGRMVAAALAPAWPTFHEFEVVAVAKQVTTDIDVHMARPIN